MLGQNELRLQESHQKQRRKSRQADNALVSAVAWFALWVITFCSSPVFADAPAATKRFSDEVVAKADGILEGVGLKRSGKTLASINTTEISRAISGLSKDRRALRQVHQEWRAVATRLEAIRVEMEQLNSQDGKLSFQLATLQGDDVITNNRYVAMINATRARIRELVTERDRLKETELVEKRNSLSKAESDYANLVLAIRRSYREVHDKLGKDLETDPVKIALGVMTANFETPRDVTADQILSSLDKRIEKIEQEIFSESITLDVDNGSMYVDVSIGNKTARMVLDSGATLVSLPATTANDLGINIPADARKMQLIMADGRTIDARAVTLSRVRVGEFEATNVEAAVLDAAATGAEPLLGMSYLSNFKFEIDSAAKSLKMLRVGSDKE